MWQYQPNFLTDITIGAMIIMVGATDEDIVESLVCDICNQYALHNISFAGHSISDSTFSRLRECCYLHEIETGERLIKQEILSLADVIDKVMKP